MDNVKYIRCGYLESQLAVSQVRISDFEHRLQLDSWTISKPPGSDGLVKQSVRTGSLREAGKNPSGGKAGHKGETLERAASPDHVVVQVLLELLRVQ